MPPTFSPSSAAERTFEYISSMLIRDESSLNSGGNRKSLERPLVADRKLFHCAYLEKAAETWMISRATRPRLPWSYTVGYTLVLRSGGRVNVYEK